MEYCCTICKYLVFYNQHILQMEGEKNYGKNPAGIKAALEKAVEIAKEQL